MSTLKTLWQSAWILWLYATDKDIEIKKDGYIMEKYPEEQIKKIAYALWIMYPKVADDDTKPQIDILKNKIKKHGWKFTK